jgi:hypothetical protein
VEKEWVDSRFTVPLAQREDRDRIDQYFKITDQLLGDTSNGDITEMPIVSVYHRRVRDDNALMVTSRQFWPGTLYH